jgi:hypothetical protein
VACLHIFNKLREVFGLLTSETREEAAEMADLDLRMRLLPDPPMDSPTSSASEEGNAFRFAAEPTVDTAYARGLVCEVSELD